MNENEKAELAAVNAQEDNETDLSKYRAVANDPLEVVDPPTLLPDDEPLNKAPWPDPMPSTLETRPFNAVWEVIKRWDINVPDVYGGYCGATGNHVRAILASLLNMTTDDWNALRASLDGEREYFTRKVSDGKAEGA